jgi:Protein of unknown function (DUF2905)
MGSIVFTALIILLTLGAIAYVAERFLGSHKSEHPPVYSLLPGDIKYESPSGNFKFYFPVTTSIVLSVVLSLLARFF